MTEKVKKEISFLQSLEAGRPYKKLPWLGVIYGDGKCSKTGIATYAPDPFFISLDPYGVDWVFANPVTAARCQTFKTQDNGVLVAKNISQVYDMMKWVQHKGQAAGVKTVVLDGIKFFEEWTYQQTVIDNPIVGSGDKAKKAVLFEDFGMDRYDLSKGYWLRLMAGAKMLKDKGFNVLLIAHSALKTRAKDNGDTYKETVIDLPMWGSLNVPNMLHRECDWIYFIDSQVQTSTSGQKKWAKQIARSDSELNTRINTRATSAYYAGSRSASEQSIPDYYVFTRDDRDEVIKQMFADLEA